jgi:hypothetical protein
VTIDEAIEALTHIRAQMQRDAKLYIPVLGARLTEVREIKPLSHTKMQDDKTSEDVYPDPRGVVMF